MRKGKHGHKGKHGKKGSGYGKRSIPLPSPEPQLVSAVKQAQTWGKILDAIPDEETKQLARDEFAKIGVSK